MMASPITDWLRVSYSSLNVHKSCERKFEFTKLMPRRVRDNDAYAADCGSALHAGYQNYLWTQDEDAAYWAFMQRFPYEFERMQKNDYRSLEACTATLQAMLDSVVMGDYELATIRHPDGRNVPAIEVPFELRIKGITLPDGRGVAFTGYIDALMRNLINGQYKTCDIKTNRATMSDSTAKYKYDGQQLPYGIVLEHIQGNPVDDFTVQYLDCFVDLVDPKVSLYEFHKDSDDVKEWLLDTVLTIQQIQRAMEMDHFPRTKGGCVSWNRPCWFLEPCATRDKGIIHEWLLMGEEAAPREVDVPWIVAEIDVFGED
jgi:hypothetical protein